MIVLKGFANRLFYSSVRWKSNKACIVYVTDTTNPYQNLAFETWMYDNVDFRHHNCLFIWRSKPCVVIGRHQNPWKECDVREVRRNEVLICRRSSGGGAVFHDLGNLNFTFFAHRQDYNRKRNLRIIVSALKKQWPLLDVGINKRDDIVLNDEFKISGSSSKLGRNATYHHCTLLIDSNKKEVIKNLTKIDDHIFGNATPSVRSTVLNLADIDNSINIKDVSNAVSSAYIQEHASSKIYQINTNDEVLSPGIQTIAKDLQDWKWIYGKTPDFSVEKSYSNDKFGIKSIKILVKKGLVNDIIVEFEHKSNTEEIETLIDSLRNVRFDHEFILDELKCVQSSSFCNHLSIQLLKLL